MLMVESGSASISKSPPNMLNSNGNQYLQPDYLSPLPATLDSKRSPLALLAQTCSQIGADSSVMKPSEKSRTKEDGSSERTKSGKTPLAHSNRSQDKQEDKTGSKSPSVISPKLHHGSSTSSGVPSGASEASGTSRSQEPLGSRPGLDPSQVSLLAGRPPFGSVPGLHPYVGLDPAALGMSMNALRHPYPMLGSLPPYPHLALSAGYSALGYGRVKSVSGSDPLLPVPVCRDPYCTGCPGNMFAVPPAASGSSGVCPAGCTQCDHQKVAAVPTSTPATVSAQATGAPTPSSPSSAQRPYVCNWIAGDTYCGKRFTSSEELLQHLRTHTSLSVPSLDGAGFPGLLSPHSPLLHQRTYPTPPLSPLSMARFHPYSKPGSYPPLGSTNPLLGLGAPPAPNPLAVPFSTSGLSPYPLSASAPFAGLSAYYSSPHFLYAQQRLGAGALP